VTTDIREFVFLDALNISIIQLQNLFASQAGVIESEL
jgi:hypothetical protein